MITLLGVSPTTVYRGSVYTDMGVMATDNVSGNISGLVSVSGSVNTSLTGSYVLTYTVSDGVGNMALPVSRIVNVVVAPIVIMTAQTSGAGGGGSAGSTTNGDPLILFSASAKSQPYTNTTNMQL